jgi:hypothetical protein
MGLEKYFKISGDNSCPEGYIRVKVIKKFLRLRINCTPEGRRVCQGKCCKSPTLSGLYEERELDKLPEDIKRLLIPQTITDKPTYMAGRRAYSIPKNDRNECVLADMCIRHPELKPAICWLFPLQLKKTGNEYRLEFHHWAMLHCPNFGEGPEAWVALKGDIIQLFGEEFYKRLEEEMRKPGDSPFYICMRKWW